jgi:hypothetical protein
MKVARADLTKGRHTAQQTMTPQSTSAETTTDRISAGVALMIGF